MNNIIGLIIVLLCYSQYAYGPSLIYKDSEALATYLDLERYKEHLTAYKSTYNNGNLDYRLYPAHEKARNIMLLKYAECDAILEWIELGEIMVRSLNSNSSVHVKNNKIYPVYWVKLIDLTRTCEK